MKSFLATKAICGIISIALVLGGCLVAIPAYSLTKVTLQLAWIVEGTAAPEFVALEKGFFREAGLEVTIQPGQGSFDAVRIVGAGTAQFGLADAGTMAKGVSQGLPVTMVAMFYQDTPMVIASLKKTGITRPKDLEGHAIGMAPWESIRFVLPVFAKLNGVDINKIKVVPLSFATKIPSLLAGKVDSLGGYLQELGNPFLMGVKPPAEVEINLIKFSEYGIEMYSNGIIVNNTYMRQEPEKVRAFVRAFLKGLEFALDRPEEAIGMLKRHTAIKPDVLLAMFNSIRSILVTDETRKHGFGWMDRAKWESTQRIMVEYGGQKTTVPLEQLFTNRFLR